MSAAPFTIGSDIWPGLAKVIEETSELGQVLGKLLAYPEGEHPDGAGPLPERLADELADVLAAVDYLRAHAVALVPLQGHIAVRRRQKFERFQRWDFEERATAC
jgi:hypothetical protein